MTDQVLNRDCMYLPELRAKATKVRINQGVNLLMVHGPSSRGLDCDTYKLNYRNLNPTAMKAVCFLLLLGAAVQAVKLSVDSVKYSIISAKGEPSTKSYVFLFYCFMNDAQNKYVDYHLLRSLLQKS